MINKLDLQDLWSYLKNTTKPIVLYGMGNGADMVIDVLENLGIEFCDIFASDKFVRGHFFHGKKVLKYSDVCEKYDDFIILMTFAVHDCETLNHIQTLSQKHEFFSATVPIVGDELFTLDYVLENQDSFKKAYDLLSDEKSKQSYIDVINFKITGKIQYLLNCQSEKMEIYDNIFHLSESEHFVDLGAYDGDTVREFLEACHNEYEKITAFEPDAKNFKKMQAKTEEVEKITRHNLGAWDKKETLYFAKKAGRNSRINSEGIAVNFDSVDNVVISPVTFLKMDIEGAEKNALIGAARTIKEQKPKLYVCAYHRNEDMFELPLLIESICSGYKFHFRHHPYVPSWESNFYCVYGEE